MRRCDRHDMASEPQQQLHGTRLADKAVRRTILLHLALVAFGMSLSTPPPKHAFAFARLADVADCGRRVFRGKAAVSRPWGAWSPTRTKRPRDQSRPRRVRIRRSPCSICLANPRFTGIPTLPRLRPRLRCQRYASRKDCGQNADRSFGAQLAARYTGTAAAYSSHFATRCARPSFISSRRGLRSEPVRRGGRGKNITTGLWLPRSESPRNLDLWPPTFLGSRPDRLSAGVHFYRDRGSSSRRR